MHLLRLCRNRPVRTMGKRAYTENNAFALTVYQLNTSNTYFRSVRVPLYGGSVPVAMICHLFVRIALSQTAYEMELTFPLKIAH